MFTYLSNFSLTNQALLIYFIFINILTFAFFGYDKFKAEWHTHRVRELTLWILCLLGGSLGGLLAMNLFRHKTKKLSFQAGLTVIICLQIWLTYWLIK